MTTAWTAARSTLSDARRLDPEYFDPRTTEVREAIERKGWAPLGDYARWAARGASPRYDVDGELRVVKTTHVRRSELARFPEEFVALEDFDGVETPTVPWKSLLITSTGVGSAGRVFLYLGNDQVAADGHVSVLPLTVNPLKAAFICAYLQSPHGRQQLLRAHRGSSRQIEIYPNDLLAMPIPTLGDETERAIGAKWLAATRAVRDAATAVSDAEAQIADLLGIHADDLDSSPTVWSSQSDYLRSNNRIDASFNSPRVGLLREKIREHSYIPFADLIKHTRLSYQPPSYDDNGGVRVIKTKDVIFPTFDPTTCEKTGDHQWTDPVKAGDVLLNMTGEGTLGRATVAPAEVDTRETFAAVDVAAVSIDTTLLPAMYVALFLNSWMGREQTLAAQTGSSGQQHLYAAHFASILIPYAADADGSIDSAWVERLVQLASRRATATREASALFAELDRFFEEALGVEADLSTIPA